ncbi:MAG: hypothetical protein L6R45_20095 [Anaerolineae bacterium]|nr:hypothetical protein [Anaerolineae bacterium]
MVTAGVVETAACAFISGRGESPQPPTKPARAAKTTNKQSLRNTFLLFIMGVVVDKIAQVGYIFLYSLTQLSNPFCQKSTQVGVVGK